MAVEQEIAVFNCQHLSANDVEWLLNGTSLERAGVRNVSSSVQFNGNIKHYTLSIVTHLEYNQTTVECVATFNDGSPPQFTGAVTLLIQGELIVNPRRMREVTVVILCVCLSVCLSVCPLPS